MQTTQVLATVEMQKPVQMSFNRGFSTRQLFRSSFKKNDGEINASSAGLLKEKTHFYHFWIKLSTLQQANCLVFGRGKLRHQQGNKFPGKPSLAAKASLWLNLLFILGNHVTKARATALPKAPALGLAHFRHKGANARWHLRAINPPNPTRGPPGVPFGCRLFGVVPHVGPPPTNNQVKKKSSHHPIKHRFPKSCRSAPEGEVEGWHQPGSMKLPSSIWLLKSRSLCCLLCRQMECRK